ncbi:MAG: hypothetical protein WCD18_11275 [Thermosynechococcaceae cyanobacterium]
MKTPKTLTHGLLAGLAILNLSIAGMAQAGPNTLTRGSHGAAYIPAMSSDFPMMAMKYKMNVTPFNLVFLAFHGFFMSEGIPSDEGLIRAYRDGQVSPEDLTKAAISMNRLSADSLSDKDYLANVKSQLDTLTRPD